MLHARIEIASQECWIGVFWRQCEDSPYWRTDVWVCVVPCVPLHLWWNREV